MSENKTIEEGVNEVIEEYLGLAAGEAKPEADICDDLGADSLDQVEIIMYLEEYFAIDIEDSEANKVKTVQDVIDLVKLKKG